MVRYKLGISDKKESRVVDLDSIIKIKELEKLDELTLQFNKEEELKMYLLNRGLINKDELSKSLSIMYKYSDKIKKLPILYSDIKKYIDIDSLKHYLKSMSSDIEFLEKLARHYSIGSDRFNPQGVNVSDIRLYIGDVRSNGGNIFFSRALEIALEDMWKKASFKKFDITTGEVEINYRGIRDLALLIYNYKNKKENQEIEEKKEKQVNVIKNSVNQEWIQMSLFDNESNIPKEKTHLKKY